MCALKSVKTCDVGHRGGSHNYMFTRSGGYKGVQAKLSIDIHEVQFFLIRVLVASSWQGLNLEAEFMTLESHS